MNADECRAPGPKRVHAPPGQPGQDLRNSCESPETRAGAVTIVGPGEDPYVPSLFRAPDLRDLSGRRSNHHRVRQVAFRTHDFAARDASLLLL